MAGLNYHKMYDNVPLLTSAQHGWRCFLWQAITPEHFSLNQWLPDDQVKRTDFNEDNAKIDSAGRDLAAAQAEKADQTALDALAAEVAKKGHHGGAGGPQ